MALDASPLGLATVIDHRSVNDQSAALTTRVRYPRTDDVSRAPRILLIEPPGSAEPVTLSDAEISLVTTGREAFDTLQRANFDLVIAVLEAAEQPALRDVSAFDLLAFLQAHHTEPPAVVLLAPQRTSDSVSDSLLDAGAAALLFSPVTAQQLRATVRSVLLAQRSERQRQDLLAEMRRYGQRLHAIVENLSGIVFETHGSFDVTAHRVTYVSQYISELGLRASDLSRERGRWLDVIHPEDHKQLFDTADKVLVRRSPSAVSFRIFKGDGQIVPLAGHLYPILDEDSHPIGLRGVVLDQTQQVTAEQELLRAKQHAESMSSAKDHFLSVVSHELRTPLTPVMSSLELLESEKLPKSARPLLDIIKRNVELEARLIDDLLDLTRLQKGKLTLNLAPIDLHSLIANVLTIVSAELRQKNVEISVDLAAEQSRVMGDAARLQQIIWNLVHNAIKFSTEGNAVAVRTVDGTTSSGSIVLEIADHGIGIEPELLPHIFDAFDKGDLYITKQFGGLGLGLTIARTLIELHGGVITAESAGLNTGATFRIELPLAISGDRDGKGTSGAKQDARPAILLVDDHEDTGRVLELLLERRGYAVERTTTCAEAVAAARRGDFDLLLSDIGLPDGTGYALLQEIREFAPNLPALAVSGFGTNDDIARSLAAGFIAHITKPFNFQDLLSRIKDLVKR